VRRIYSKNCNGIVKFGQSNNLTISIFEKYIDAQFIRKITLSQKISYKRIKITKKIVTTVFEGKKLLSCSIYGLLF
jgi:hypothetical protein